MMAVRRLLKAVKMRKKLNSKGLSLVEIIVAVVVFAAAVAPTMRLFSSAVGNNSRSREQQRALAVAESTMESFKAYTVKDLCVQFGAVPGSASAGAAYATNTGAFKGVSYDAATALSVQASGSGGALPALNADESLNHEVTDYTFTIKDAIQEGQKYDVTVDLVRIAAPQTMNMKEQNPYTDAVVQRKSDDITDIKLKIYAKAQESLDALANPADMISGGSKTLESVTISSVDRKITLTAETDGAAEKVKEEIVYDYEASYTYKYVTSSGAKTKTGPVISGTIQHVFNEATGATEELVYDNSATIASAGGRLEEINLYYCPMYAGAVGATSATDTIEIDTSAVAGGTEPVVIHVVKQKLFGISDTLLNIYETGYHVNVTGSSDAVLYHNLSESLTGVGTIYPPTITNFAKDCGLEEELEEKGLIYSVAVNVYKAGDTNAVANFSGTMNN